MEKMSYPEYVAEALARLESAGHAAYLVGGSLRDMLLGIKAHDFDVATSARPDETLRVFSDHRVIETGLQHGTVTVLFDHEPVEITTFRIDGSYRDSRHPDSVTFTDCIAEDLSRRDFTVNAMAYSPTRGFADPFSGREDLERRVLRAVRDPKERFREDALRILRAFRFSAQLGFEIEEKTLSAIADTKEGLSRIARERVGAECIRLLCSPRPEGALRAMMATGVLPYVTGDFVPSKRSLANMSEMPREDVGRLGLLLSDATDAQISEILQGLRCSTKQKKGTAAVVRGAKRCVNTPKDAASLIAETGIYASLAVRASVLLGISPPEAEALVRDNRVPVSIGELAVSGKDLASLGFRGAQIGQALDEMLVTVMENPAYNTRERLLALAKERIEQKDE